ncbi:tyrosine-type recombinase/integrase [Salinigranum halophilum]|uniref:tyrosine-type recombinase/integrase n=1 Tax=Salinigranum halophilum TaxID=2565931 RepID=UPI0010A8DFD1|nr:tyrosine-type recombinase/integrase [Salinigranum halophilum]
MSREDVAAAFGRDLDPLSEHAPVFEQLDLDVFEAFLEETGPRAPNTERNYRNSFRHWRRFMEGEGRHPACPSRSHVERYVEERAEDVRRSTIKTELVHVGAAHSYWCRDEAYPHTADFDPFDVDPPAGDEPDDYPRVTLDDLREAVASTGHYLDRAVLVLQLKLGLRATELCNVRMEEVNIDGLRDFYPDIGTHPEVADRPGSLYVPTGREGNKSRRARVLPLDDEARRCLARYLLVRPTCGRDGMLLSKREKVPLTNKHVSRVWRQAMPDRLAEPGDKRPVRSHYGRHHFTTYWDVHRDWNSELVAYMRGDAAGSRNAGGSDSMSHYLHAHYEDIEAPYREQVFKLGV